MIKMKNNDDYVTGEVFMSSISNEFDLGNFKVYSRFAQSLCLDKNDEEKSRSLVGKYLKEWFDRQAKITGQKLVEPKDIDYILDMVISNIMAAIKTNRVHPLVFPANRMVEGFQHDLLILVVYDNEIFNSPEQNSLEWMWLKTSGRDPLRFAFLANNGDSTTL